MHDADFEELPTEPLARPMESMSEMVSASRPVRVEAVTPVEIPDDWAEWEDWEAETPTVKEHCAKPVPKVFGVSRPIFCWICTPSVFNRCVVELFMGSNMSLVRRLAQLMCILAVSGGMFWLLGPILYCLTAVVTMISLFIVVAWVEFTTTNLVDEFPDVFPTLKRETSTLGWIPFTTLAATVLGALWPVIPFVCAWSSWTESANAEDDDDNADDVSKAL